VDTLKTLKEHGYNYRELASVITSLSPFADDGFNSPGDRFPDLCRDFSQLVDEQKNDLQAEYRKKLKVLAKEFGV